MELKQLRQKSLFGLFLKQFITFAFLIFGEIVVFIALFYIALYRDIFLPADYAEQALKERKEQIAICEPFDETLIPFTCHYSLFDSEYRYISGNMEKKSLEKAEELLKNRSLFSTSLFYLVQRKDGYCVIEYDVKAHFSSPRLHQLCPNPEWVYGVFFVTIFLWILIRCASKLNKKLQKELKPLLEEVEAIQRKDLGIESKNSEIKEVNEILHSLNEMRIALSQSLESEWRAEQARKTHISALAHDIRTPLTIIKGNAELIQEEVEREQINQYARSINVNAEKIDRYINLLIDATKEEYMPSDKKEVLSLKQVISDIKSAAESLCKTKNIELIVIATNLNPSVEIEEELVIRAVLNIVRNAVEYSKEGSKIHLTFEYHTPEFTVITEDYGGGFTEEALRYATTQFYTGKKERANENYGLGMYIANKVAKSYHGKVAYENNSDGTGAVVRFQIILEQQK